MQLALFRHGGKRTGAGRPRAAGRPRVGHDGMQGFQISVAKNINRALVRHGKVFADRYHSHVLRTPREARNVTSYVLNNFRKHGESTSEQFDPYSTGRWFQGWIEGNWWPESFDDPNLKWALFVWLPKSWLLRNVTGISMFAVPGA